MEFLLTQEPWIRVLLPDCTIQEVSLTEALVNAHEYVDLAGETPAQDVAMLRLLLAVLHTVFSRVDEQGEPAPLEDAEGIQEVLDRWKALWEMGRFPAQPLRDYFTQWQDRFWLFHPERPFWQVPEAKIGTEYTSAKLNGELSESSNKIRLFSNVAGQQKNVLTYGEAARWLLYVNGFDDTSAKPKGKNLPSPGVGWLGKLGLITAVGNNLFETLLLNLTLLKDGDEDFWQEAPLPTWEREVPRTKERTEIVLPENQAELLTLQSRRLILHRDGEKVVGYQLLGGDFFQRQGAFSEQMTVWKADKTKAGSAPEYTPKRHDSSKRLWREFGNVFVAKTGQHLPGVVSWYKTLAEEMNWPRNNLARFRIVSVQYGDKDFFVNDAFSDSLTFHSDLLTEMGLSWQNRIEQEIGKCDELAKAIWILASNLVKAAGGSTDVGDEKAQLYDRLDQPFRLWLESIEPEEMDIGQKAEEWQTRAKNITLRLGKELVSQAGPSGFVGREFDSNGSTVHVSAPEAYNSFVWRVNQIYQKG